MKNKVYLIISLFSIWGCNISKQEDYSVQKIENIELSPIKTLNRISDTILIGQMSAINVEDNIIMLAESSKSRILVTDTNFNLRYILGNTRGAGPGEFNHVFSPIIRNNKIYAYDQGNQRINIFNKTKGEFIKSIKLADRISSTTYDFFLDKENNIYFPTDPEKDGKVFLKLDSNGVIIKKFGNTLLKADNIAEQTNSNYRELAVENDRIITIATSLGIVELFDLEGNKISSFDISNYEPIKTTEKLVKEDAKNNPEQTSILNLSVYVRGNEIFVPIADRSTQDVNSITQVLVFNWSDKYCKLSKKISFKTNKDDNGQICMVLFPTRDKKYVYMQGLVTKQLYVFKMP